MNDPLEILAQVESGGTCLTLDGDKVKISYPTQQHREHVGEKVEFLRAHRNNVVTWLKSRSDAPTMPPGVRLLYWILKEPPVAIDQCATVVDPPLFARTTLQQLAIAIANPKRWVGWSVSQLIDRLHQVGVAVAVESRGHVPGKI